MDQPLSLPGTEDARIGLPDDFMRRADLLRL